MSLLIAWAPRSWGARGGNFEGSTQRATKGLSGDYSQFEGADHESAMCTCRKFVESGVIWLQRGFL